MAEATRNPTSDDAVSGTWTGTAGSRWSVVDDYPDTSGADVLVNGTAAGALTFGFSVFAIPAGAKSITVFVDYYDSKNGSQSCAIGSRLKIGGTYHNSSTHNPANANITQRTDTFANNPKTGAAWTVDDVNGTGSNPLQAFGWNSTDASPTINLTSVRVRVSYTPPVIGTLAETDSEQTDAITAEHAAITGVLSETDSQQTDAASGIARIAAAVTEVQSAQVDVASGAARLVGALSETESQQTDAGAGATRIVGALSEAEAQQIDAGGGSTRILGALVETSSVQTEAAAGGALVAATISESQTAQTEAAQAGVRVSGQSLESSAPQIDAIEASHGGIVGSLAETDAQQTEALSGSVLAAGAVTEDSAKQIEAAGGTVRIAAMAVEQSSAQTEASSGGVLVAGSTVESQALQGDGGAGSVAIQGALSESASAQIENVEAVHDWAQATLVEVVAEQVDAGGGGPWVHGMLAEIDPAQVDNIGGTVGPGGVIQGVLQESTSSSVESCHGYIGPSSLGWMLPYQDAPADLRRLSPRTTALSGDPGSSIQGINAFDLPDGAVCFAQDVGFDYRFRRESTTAPMGDDVIQPSAGPGRWFKEAGSNGIPNPALASDALDDFIAGDPGSEWSWLSNQSGAGSAANISNMDLDANHQGILLLQTGVTAAGRAGLRLSNVQSNIAAGGGTMSIEWLVKVETLSAVAQEFTFLSGFSDVTGAGLFTTNAIQFVYDRLALGTNWQAFARGGAAPQTIDTGVAVVAGAWVKLRIELTPTIGAEFFINEISVATVALVNLPGATAAGAFGANIKIQKSAGTSQRRALADFVVYGYEFSPAR